MLTLKAGRYSTRLLVLLLILSACGTAKPNPTPAPKLRIGYNQWAGSGAVFIASEKGLFKKAGVDVELVRYDSIDVANSDFAAKKLDGNLAPLTDGVAQAALGLPVQVVWICDNSLGGDAVVGSKDIASPADLKGKRVGLSYGTFGHLFVLKGLAKYGLTAADITVINMPSENVAKALANGEIDAGHTWDPFLSEAVSKGGHLLFTSADTPGAIVDSLLFRSEVVKSRPDDVKAILKAITDGEAYWKQNPDEGNQIVAKVVGVKPEEMPGILTGIKIFSLQDNVEAFKPAAQNTQSITHSVQDNIDFLTAAKIIKQAPEIATFVNGAPIQALASQP